MENNENLDMSLFDNSDSLELNLGGSPFDLENENNNPPVSKDGDKPTDDDGDNKNINPNEGTDPEKVVEDGLDKEGDDTDDNSPNIYSPLASVLNEQGLLPSLDNIEDIKDADSLATAFKAEINNQYKSYIIDKLGEDGYDALEKGVSLSDYQQYQDNNLVLDSIDVDKLSENLELSKNIILQDYIAQGLSEDRAHRILSKTIELGEEAIIEDAQQSLVSLKEHQSVKLERIKAENALKIEKDRLHQDKIDNDLKNSIYNAKEIIKDIKLNKTIQDNLYNSITKIVSKNPENGILENEVMRARRENPIDFDVKLHYFWNLTNGFKDFSKLTTKSTSNAVNQLEDVLRRTKSNDNNGQPGFMNDPSSYGGFGDEIVF